MPQLQLHTEIEFVNNYFDVKTVLKLFQLVKSAVIISDKLSCVTQNTPRYRTKMPELDLY